ncbi:hypothetical protein AMECASPLE_004624 [Ameca splendens]|uniref:Uncharacterized protein n=1 Tax=Ameca splendens TaxID=208324 RepID=A0ABV0XMW8_9TELE
MLSACVLPLYRAACFLHTPTLCQHLSQIYHIFLQHPVPFLILIFHTIHFFHQVSVISFCFILTVHVSFGMYVYVCLPSLCMLFCVRVIIGRPPRGNQQWSLDSPDPLVPHHMCPRWAVLTSSEPLYESICVYVLLYHLSSCLVALEWACCITYQRATYTHIYMHSSEQPLRIWYKKMTNKHKR